MPSCFNVCNLGHSLRSPKALADKESNLERQGSKVWRKMERGGRELMRIFVQVPESAWSLDVIVSDSQAGTQA